MASSLPSPPLASSRLSSRNPYNQPLRPASPIHTNPITEPAPTLVNRTLSRNSSFEVERPIEMASLSSGSSHGSQRDALAHPGTVHRVEEGLHNINQKTDYELGVVPGGRTRRQVMWDRFRGRNRRKIGWGESARNVLFSSMLNVFLIFIPFAWVSHWAWDDKILTFVLSFLSIIPLSKLFDFGGEQMALYTGKDLGDLIIVTLNNAVEATLAIILLSECQLRTLQATVVGVVLLHLLLVPGTGFLTGGRHIYEQSLHPHYTQLNNTLLAIGVLSLLVPAAFFAALDSGSNAQSTLTSDAMRKQLLQMSRGIAVMLLLVYIASRIFLHNPPGDGNAFRPMSSAPTEVHREEEHLAQEEPKVKVWFCILMLLATIAVMATTAEMLVEALEHIRSNEMLASDEWFGLILLPLVSFSADGTIAIMYFIRRVLFLAPEPPKTLAEDRAIDLSIQFTLFWMPFFVIISWLTGKPFMLLFDLYEVAVLLGASFLVNYVTADSKTNWAEGYIMVTFYFMIALCTWFYSGQAIIETLLESCVIGDHSPEGDPLGEAAAVAEEVVGDVVDDLSRRLVRLM